MSFTSKMFKYLSAVLLAASLVSLAETNALASPGYDCEYCQPEQIHIAFGENTSDIIVTWSTFNDTEESWVEFGVDSLNLRKEGSNQIFVDGGDEHRHQFIHTVTLNNLKPDTKYYYHVGSEYGWSEQFYFHTPPAGDNYVVRAAVFGDMGNKNAHSLSYLQEEAQAGLYDVIIHVGDFAYDMDTENARVGDQFMRQIQPLAAYVPYMTCPGNHEEKYNFSNYKARFSMPRGDDMFFTWHMGPVRFVSVNTEYYYYLNYGFKMLGVQYDWLDRTLREANEPENRSKQPWVVVYGHRPMYCSNADDVDDCDNEYTRRGIPLLGLYGIEPLLMKYGVDLVIWAHEHSYERTWPLYDGKVYNGSYDKPYENPGAPVQIVTGSAGCQERTDNFNPHPQPWSAFRSSDYGYSRLNVYNHTHLYFEQVDVDLKGQVIDRLWLTKHYHGAYKMPKHH